MTWLTTLEPLGFGRLIDPIEYMYSLLHGQDVSVGGGENSCVYSNPS